MLHPVLTVVAAGIMFSAILVAQSRLHYPDARRSDQVDTYFGERVADPYRWLEDVDSPETREWVEAENKLTFSYLDRIPERESIRRRMTELYNYERYAFPLEVRGRVFYAHNSGLQKQNVFFYQDGVAGAAHVLIDPNALSADGTVAVDGFVPNQDGSLVAYSTAQAGSDWATWKIRDVSS